MSSAVTTAASVDESYPLLRPEVSLHRTAAGAQILVAVPTTPDQGLRFQGRVGSDEAVDQTYNCDGYMVDYLAQIDGTRTKATIDSLFGQSYGPFAQVLADRAWAWIERQNGLVDLRDEPAPAPAPPKLTGNDAAYYPLHSIIEIIETCNFACDHCYYSSDPSKKGRLSLEQTITVMDTLAANGVRIVELTGGECTIHPDFLAILDKAVHTFEMVAIVTNGYRIGTNQKFADAVCRYPNIFAQVSIDAMGATHDLFRKHRNAFEGAVNAIKRLRDAGIPVRMASSISEATLDQVEPLVRLGRELEVDAHSFAPISPIGRGCNVSEAGTASKELIERLNRALVDAGHTIPTYSEVPPAGDTFEKARNCGAGSRSFTVNYEGEVRACNFARESKKFGNLLDDDYQSIFGQQSSFFFANAPSPGGIDCHGCPFETHCRGCFVKAFLVSETEFPQCPWRKRWFPNMSLDKETEPTGHLSAAQKRSNVPHYSPADSPHACRSCQPSPAAAGMSAEQPQQTFLGSDLKIGRPVAF